MFASDKYSRIVKHQPNYRKTKITADYIVEGIMNNLLNSMRNRIIFYISDGGILISYNEMLFKCEVYKFIIIVFSSDSCFVLDLFLFVGI